MVQLSLNFQNMKWLQWLQNESESTSWVESSFVLLANESSWVESFYFSGWLESSWHLADWQMSRVEWSHFLRQLEFESESLSLTSTDHCAGVAALWVVLWRHALLAPFVILAVKGSTVPLLARPMHLLLNWTKLGLVFIWIASSVGVAVLLVYYYGAVLRSPLYCAAFHSEFWPIKKSFKKVGYERKNLNESWVRTQITPAFAKKGGLEGHTYNYRKPSMYTKTNNLKMSYLS